MNIGATGRVAAVVLAGGAGTRFGADVCKVYVPLGGRPILAYSLDVMEASDRIDDVVVVIRPEDRPTYDQVAADVGASKVRAVVAGGATRQASEWAGIQAVRDRCPGALVVVVHDGARPLLTSQLIARLVQTSQQHASGALPARPLAAGLVAASGAPRPGGDLVAVETPQVFPLAVLLAVYPMAMAEGVEGIDTAQTVQSYSGLPIRWVPAGPPNPKITHPQDLPAVEALLPAWERPDARG
ncbi:MAG TPA: IspD/TarI family cytidylyltransferase [Euzebya sp.]|nr:IspD/TarI family cytidylyltransferase [Euzebya sp.]